MSGKKIVHPGASPSSPQEAIGEAEPSAATTFFDEGVRIESLIYLPGTLVDEDAFPEAFRDFCEYLPEEGDAPLYRQLPALTPFASTEDWPEPTEVADRLVMARAAGFLVQAAIPVRSYFSGGSYLSSWGHYQTEWLYAETAADIERLCVEWARVQDAKFRATALGRDGGE